MNLKINQDSDTPKYRQIADSLTGFIEAGELKVGDKLPSIDTVSRSNNVAKETVVQAYKHLRANGIIVSSQKKGFYVQTNVTGKQWRVLVLFNIMSPSKEIMYKGIVNTLKDKAQIELFFHNYNLEMFENIIRSKAAMFHYFIVMPHFDPAAREMLKAISPERLIILDRPLLKHIEGASSVHQNFREDVFDVLTSEKGRIKKYKKIIILAPEGGHLPEEIFNGIKKFGASNKMPVSIAHKAQPGMLKSGTLFISLTDDLLISSIELQQQTSLKIGKDIGIISYNENPLKRILVGGITTLTSDFEQMGKTAAACIMDKKIRVVRNPFYLIIRNSI
ncbi:MAG TPA: GntR family transcriptional regulator [Chitinophagaceae bacterium]